MRLQFFLFARLEWKTKCQTICICALFNILINISLNLFFLIWCPKAIASRFNLAEQHLWSCIWNRIYISLTVYFQVCLHWSSSAPEIGKLNSSSIQHCGRQMVVYAFPLMIAGYAGMVNETFDRILLPYLLADKSQAITQLGIYGACYKIVYADDTCCTNVPVRCGSLSFFSQAGKMTRKNLRACHVLFCC